MKIATLVLICVFLKCSILSAQKNPQTEQTGGALSMVQSTKPNVIFILADDIGYDVLTVNGGESYSTPNLDSMARHGMNFTHCESTPLCSPSRVMFLSGKYNFRNYSNWGYMNESEKTVANVMHDSGYTTGIFGKLQLQYSNARMHNWGWDSHLVFETEEDTISLRRYKDPILVDNGYRLPDSVTAGKYCDDILTQRICDFIDSNQSKPFFVYYSMSIGHKPYSPTPDDAAFASWNGHSEKSDTSFFASMVKYMDKKVGKILNKLRLAGLDQNTLVFFAGDNGTQGEIRYNAHGVKNIPGDKSSSREGGTHVPLIAYWPGMIQEGSLCDNLIDFTDLLPTMAQAARLKITGQYGILDGTSFYPRLVKQLGKGKPQLYFHYDPHPGGYDSLSRWVRDKNYKLYDSAQSYKRGEFYNIKKDITEMHPLDDSQLTAEQLSIKALFKHILDTAGTWPACPVLTNAFITNITSSAATIGGTIIGEGASPLIDRGSNMIRAAVGLAGPFLYDNRMHATSVSLGTFSQRRKGLSAQTLFKFDMYAMNENLGHSTGFVYGQFYTLSKAPLKQPVSFTAAVNDSATTLSWSNATFPSTGASNAGYLLLYSPNTPPPVQDIKNGEEPPRNKGHIVALASVKLPLQPAKKAEIRNLSKDSTYYFALVPYTWDGVHDSTYNYLTEDALTLTIQQVNNATSFESNDLNKNDHESAAIRLFPNPVQSVLHLARLSSSLKTITIVDSRGTALIHTTTSANTYAFDTRQLSAGEYFARIDQLNSTKVLKFVKQ